MLMHLDPSSIATLKRLSFRLLVIVAVAGLWPGSSAAEATAAFCILFAAACLMAARGLLESFSVSSLSRWQEAIIIFAIGVLAFLMR
jgi:hypothetical protein